MLRRKKGRQIMTDTVEGKALLQHKKDQSTGHIDHVAGTYVLNDNQLVLTTDLDIQLQNGTMDTPERKQIVLN